MQTCIRIYIWIYVNKMISFSCVKQENKAQKMGNTNFKNVRAQSFQDYMSECNSYKVNEILKKRIAYFQVTMEVVMLLY